MLEKRNVNVLEKKPVWEMDIIHHESYDLGRAVGWNEGLEAIKKIKNNDWVPVSERLPEPDKIVYVTVHCSEWTSDYDSDWVAENEKVYHEEKYIVNVGYVDEDWHWTAFNDDGYEVCCDEEFGTDKGCVYSVVTAWLPLPEPYKGE